MLNFVVDPALLQPRVPAGTELDTWHGRTFVSIVGFLFVNTRVLGMYVPAHTSFEEVNLRFYVRRQVHGEVRRGVVFIRELVPRFGIAAVARAIYNEPYASMPMRHLDTTNTSGVRRVEYSWRNHNGWASMGGEIVGAGVPVIPSSQEEFITEHYWGYTRQRDGGTIEYSVTHPSWRVWKVSEPRITGDLEPTYGKTFASILQQTPSSAFLADGSAVTVYRPARIA